MEKALITLVKTKLYHQLTTDELKRLDEWCSTEEEFDQLKYLFMGLENNNLIQKNEKISSDVKESLDQIYHEKFQNKKKSVGHFDFKRPYLQVAAMLLLILMCYPIFYSSDDKKQTISKHKIITASHGSKKKMVDETKNEKKSTTYLTYESSVQRKSQATQIARVESFNRNSSVTIRLDFSKKLKTPSNNEIIYSEENISVVKLLPVEDLNDQKSQAADVSLDMLDLLTACF